MIYLELEELMHKDVHYNKPYTDCTVWHWHRIHPPEAHCQDWPPAFAEKEKIIRLPAKQTSPLHPPPPCHRLSIPSTLPHLAPFHLSLMGHSRLYSHLM